MKIIVILIHHRHGEDVRVALNEKDATKKLAQYASENWSESFCSIPKSPQEIVDLYFDNSSEYYEKIEFNVKPKRRNTPKFYCLNP